MDFMSNLVELLVENKKLYESPNQGDGCKRDHCNLMGLHGRHSVNRSCRWIPWGVSEVNGSNTGINRKMKVKD